MKSFYFLISACFIFFLWAGCSDDGKIFSFLNDDVVYYVVFQDNPNIQSDNIVSKGITIGKMIAKDIGTDNLVQVKIGIKKEKSPLITDSSCFVVDKGILSYAELKEGGAPLPENAKIIGFASKTSLIWYKTKIIADEVTSTVFEKAQELYEESQKKK